MRQTDRQRDRETDTERESTVARVAEAIGYSDSERTNEGKELETYTASAGSAIVQLPVKLKATSPPPEVQPCSHP